MKTNHATVVRFAAALVCCAIVGAPAMLLSAHAQTNTPAGGNKPTRVRPNWNGFELSKSGKTANQIGGASRDLGAPKLYAPNLGTSYSTNPEFHWSTPEPGGKVTFRLSSMDGQTLYETATTADHIRYPGDAPALSPGSSYRWTVVPENDMLGGPPAPVSFKIIDGPEREQILKELKSASSESATAAVFLSHLIWYDTVQAYTDLISRNPGDQQAYTTRAEVYEQIPATKSLADADWRMVH